MCKIEDIVWFIRQAGEDSRVSDTTDLCLYINIEYDSDEYESPTGSADPRDPFSPGFVMSEELNGEPEFNVTGMSYMTADGAETEYREFNATLPAATKARFKNAEKLLECLYAVDNNFKTAINDMIEKDIEKAMNRKAWQD